VKKLVIAVALVLMIAGAAVGVLKWLGIGPFSKAKDTTTEATVAAGGAPQDAPRFITMDALVIPVFKGERVAATIQIQVKLETAGVDNESKIAHLMPRLNDAFLRDLYGFLPRHLRKENRIDLSIIKRRLQRLGDKVAGPGVIKAVLIQSVIETPAR